MAFRTLIRRTDTLRVIAPGDDAIDWDACTEADIKAYYGGEYDPQKLKLKPDGKPFWCTVRALSEHEKSIIGVDGKPNVGHLAYEVCRFGIVGIESPDWKPSKETYCGFEVYTMASIETLPDHVVQFLAGVIFRHSTLSEDRQRFFVCSGDSPSGATTPNAARTTPTVARAAKAKAATRSR